MERHDRSRLVYITYDESRVVRPPYVQAMTEIHRALYGNIPERIGFIRLDVSLDVLQKAADERGYVLREETESIRTLMTGEQQAKFYRCERTDQTWEPDIAFWELPGVGMCIEDLHFDLYNKIFFSNQDRE